MRDASIAEALSGLIVCSLYDTFQSMQALEGWGSFPSIVIANPVSIATLVSIALRDQVPTEEVSTNLKLAS